VISNPYSIEICRKFLAGEDINELRHTLRDVAASFKTADFITEMQVRKSMHFHERLLYYPLKRFCDNYSAEGRMLLGADGKPNRYSSLRPVYALNFLEVSHYEDDDALRIFLPFDPVRNKGLGKDLLRIGMFELNKSVIETDNQRHWRDFFLGNEIAPTAPDYIKKANAVIDYVNLGEEEMKVADAIEKAGATLQDELDYSYFTGKSEGILEGIAKVALNFLNLGLSPEQIVAGTGLSLAEIETLRKKLP
jgi:hypothetical protein